MLFLPTRKQVLVVEPDLARCVKIIKILEDHHFDVLTAATFQGVIQKLQALQVDLVILAEKLEDTNGFEVCDTLKCLQHTRNIPVIILSLDACQIDKYSHSADDYLCRDFEPEELLTRIEAIWHRGRGIVHEYSLKQQGMVVDELFRIINEELIDVYFQPIYSLHPFRLFGLEVLSRPVGGKILTNALDLFQAAVKYNMYYALEMLCWRKALGIISSHSRNEHIFFNCNPYMIENSHFPAVKDLFEHSGMPNEKVILEITERSSIQEQGRFHDRLGEYRNQGFQFAVDDVGAGYSSLESIATTKPEIIKIDANIVRDLHQDPIKRSIVKFIVSFCKENAIHVVAEGVETREEMQAVAEMGVDAVQGYYLFRPTTDFNLRQMRDACISFS